VYWRLEGRLPRAGPQKIQPERACKKSILYLFVAPNKRAGGGNDDVTCDPQPFLIVVTETPPKSSCPPFFGFDTACERSIAPAQVPHTAFVLTNSRRGSINPDRRASSAMVVDSGGIGRVGSELHMDGFDVRDRQTSPGYDQGIAPLQLLRGAHLDHL
jgi:hypothetical protein